MKQCEQCGGSYANGYARCPECATASTPDAVVVARTKVELAIGKCVITRMSAESVRETYALLDAYAAAVRAECAAKVDDPEPCDWHQDGMGLWQTDCGNAFEFNDDGPWMNGLKFCGYCGKKLVEVPYEPMPDDDEEAQP